VAGFVQAADQLGLAATLSSLKDPAGFGAELAQLAATRATLQAATGGHVSVAEAATILGSIAVRRFISASSGARCWLWT